MCQQNVVPARLNHSGRQRLRPISTPCFPVSARCTVHRCQARSVLGCAWLWLTDETPVRLWYVGAMRCVRLCPCGSYGVLCVWVHACRVCACVRGRRQRTTFPWCPFRSLRSTHQWQPALWTSCSRTHRTLRAWSASLVPRPLSHCSTVAPGLRCPSSAVSSLHGYDRSCRMSCLHSTSSVETPS